MDSDFMQAVTALLTASGVRVIRFEFPYMVERRVSGKRRPPNRAPELLQCFHQVVQEVEQRFTDAPIYIGGKSMGGRMATLIAQEVNTAGVICFGYPFHPQGKPEKLRTEHLLDFQLPTLICQGSRDSLGNSEEVESYVLSSAIQMFWLDDGDHDLKPRVKSGHNHADHIKSAAAQACRFINETKN